MSDVLTQRKEDGTTNDIDVIVSLNDLFSNDPVIPIGKDGTLNFTNGVFTITRQAEMELYLSEISGKWLIDSLSSGFIRMYSVEQLSDVHDFIYSDGALPKGEILEGLFAGIEMYGVKLYWIGRNPDEVTEPEEMQFLLMINPETDEAAAYRVSLGMMERGEDGFDAASFFPLHPLGHRGSFFRAFSLQTRSRKRSGKKFDRPAGSVWSGFFRKKEG